jgi:hypothetical protein
VATPNNLWSFLFPTPAQCAALKLHFCASPLGLMTSAAGMPMAAFTGGLLGNCCPPGLDPNALLLPPDSAGGAAALVKADLAGAAARRAAIRFLGTVDCRYWPEAEAALIKGLRADKIECVRWEAAMALQRGCCCTTKIILALTICVSGSDVDGQPAECSPRVRDAAAVALSMCVADQPAPVLLGPPAITPPPPEILPTPIKKKELIPPEKVGPSLPTTAKADNQAHDAYRARLVEYARRVLSQYYNMPIATITPGMPPPPSRPGSNGLVGLFVTSVNSGTTSAPAVVSGSRPGADSQRYGLLNLAYNRMKSGNTVTESVITTRPSAYAVTLPAAGERVGTTYAQPASNVQTTPAGGTATPMGARMPVGPSSGPHVTSGTIQWDN